MPVGIRELDITTQIHATPQSSGVAISAEQLEALKQQLI
jgi:hypothetical protein